MLNNYQTQNVNNVTKSDSATFTPGVVWVGIGGTVTLLTSGGTTGIFFVNSGTVIPVMAQRIASTGTTASGFVIIY